MGRANLEVVRSMFAAFARGEISEVMRGIDENVEWREAESHPYADRNPYRGDEAVLNGVFARVARDWDDYRLQVEEMYEAGDAVIVTGRYKGVFKPNGRKLDAQFAYVMKFRGEKLVWYQQYTDTAQWRDVVELTHSSQDTA